jgi:RluA family pseudouridine synthase
MNRLLEDSILFEDSWVIAINKPSGLFTQAARGVPSLQVQVSEFLQARNRSSGVPFVGIIHRLDRPTSGVVLFGLNTSAVRRLNDQFRERTIVKTYLAIVKGVADESGLATDWLRKIDDVAKGELCGQDDAGAKLAKLAWRRVATQDGYSLVQVELETGRMHQIRLQLSSRGWPIVGDDLYGVGSRENEREFQGDVTEESSQSNLFGLHAVNLTFRHPKTAKEICLSSPLPDLWLVSFPWLASVDLP